MFTMLADCDDAIIHMMQSEEFITMVAITLSCFVVVVGIVGGTICSVVRSRAREQTKREIAAYVAEGSLDPDKAVAMLNAGRTKWDICSGDKVIKNA
ncbi:MAG: hypothetical protein ACYS15_02035 [Planctomycetota bacterium]|jgi:hypothetical protein